jgi:hypothetical protein
MTNGQYIIYHLPGKKVGCTGDFKQKSFIASHRTLHKKQTVAPFCITMVMRLGYCAPDCQGRTSCGITAIMIRSMR